MADYSGAYERFDPPAVPKITERTSVLNVTQSTMTVIDFGSGPSKVEQFKELARLLSDFPPGARVEVQYAEYHDGDTFKVTVNA